MANEDSVLGSSYVELQKRISQLMYKANLVGLGVELHANTNGYVFIKRDTGLSYTVFGVAQAETFVEGYFFAVSGRDEWLTREST